MFFFIGAIPVATEATTQTITVQAYIINTKKLFTESAIFSMTL